MMHTAAGAILRNC